MEKLKVLVVDDDREIVESIAIFLQADGYLVRKAYNGLEALDIVMTENVHLIILDIMMPELDGIKTLLKVRESKNLPIILLSAKSEDADKLMGFECGADDYVTKPFGMMELVSRIKAVLRRTKKKEEAEVLKAGPITLNEKKHEVLVDGEHINLTLKEYEMLKRLINNKGIVLTRDRLLEEIWGYDFDGETRTVDVHIRTLRQKLGSAGEVIETVRGVGYRITEDQEEA